MTATDTQMKEMFDAGVHFGYAKSSRHPSVKDNVLVAKEGLQVIDLEKTIASLEAAEQKIKEVRAQNGIILFVGSKNEAIKIVEENAKKIGMPFVTTRWIGGTFTNYSEIKKRVSKLSKMLIDREKGEYEKYNKKERLDLDKEILKLQKHYTGLLAMTEMPKLLIIIDSKSESIATQESQDMNIPVISISNTDCDISGIQFPIVANDSSVKSIEYIITRLTNAAITKA